MGRFIEVCRRRGLKVNSGRSEVITLNGEKGLECKVYVEIGAIGVCSNLNIWDVFYMN